MLKPTAAALLILSAVAGASAVAASPQGMTRAQVRAEVLAARAAGTLDFTEANYPPELTTRKSTVTRAEIKAEVIRARKAGELDITEATP